MGRQRCIKRGRERLDPDVPYEQADLPSDDAVKPGAVCKGPRVVEALPRFKCKFDDHPNLKICDAIGENAAPSSRFSAFLCLQHERRNLQRERRTTMKSAAIGMATALALAGTAAFAKGGSAGRERSCDSSHSPCRVTAGSSGASIGNNAGGAAAGANSALNPSGNSLINTSPNGSTLAPQ
jgi:hypothetical protein